MRISLSGLFKAVPLKAPVVMGFAGLLLAGCSSSIDRFADYPGESAKSGAATASNSGGSDEYIESSSIGTPPRAQAQNPYQPPIYNKAHTYNRAAYNPPQTYDYQAEPAPAYGATVTVEPGQTLYSIARVNGMTVATLAYANGIQPPYTVRAGQRIRIPNAGEPRAAAPPRAVPAYAPAAGSAQKTSGVHVVRSGETLFSLGRAYKVHPYKIAELNGLSNDVSLSTGQKIRIPGGKNPDRIAYQTDIEPVEETPADYPEEQTPDPSYEPENSSEMNYTSPDEGQSYSSDEQETEAVPAEEVDNTFRWPVRGRVISKYGTKPGGTRNEGINIAVPEGTSVRAAEGGVVAYAGNELKGYGNLILIRHSGGWVTAYAHNKQLFVKRGDAVRRGDIVAKAGQTGSVESPQLHFELRKGATAVDPLKYLTGSQTASNE